MPIPLRDRLVRLETTLERLFGGRPPREPLEVRRAVVESLTGEIRPVGGGRRILPIGRVTVAIVATDATEKRLFKEALVGPDGVEADLRRALDAAGAEWPRGFALAVKFVKTPGQDWRSGARFHVTASDPGAPAPAPERETSPPPGRPDDRAELVLRVTLGQAEPKRQPASERQHRPAGDGGGRQRPRRAAQRHRLAGDDGSAARCRARMRTSPGSRPGTYRVFDEQSSHGTVVSARPPDQVPPAATAPASPPAMARTSAAPSS
jgi:hypothetical protein